MNGLSCGIRKWAQVSSVLLQSTRLTDRQTDGQKCLCNTVRCMHYMQSLGKSSVNTPVVREVFTVVVTSGPETH